MSEDLKYIYKVIKKIIVITYIIVDIIVLVLFTNNKDSIKNNKNNI